MFPVAFKRSVASTSAKVLRALTASAKEDTNSIWTTSHLLQDFLPDCFQLLPGGIQLLLAMDMNHLSRQFICGETSHGDIL